jgi:hypothetical protein
VSGHCILNLQEPTLKISATLYFRDRISTTLYFRERVSTTLYFRDRISHHPRAKSRGYTESGANRQKITLKEQFVITSSSFNETSYIHTYWTSSSDFACQNFEREHMSISSN